MEYTRVIAEWETTGRRLPKDAAARGGHVLTVNELILAYWNHVESYYRHIDGTPTSEQSNIRQILRRLRIMYGHTRAAAFDGQALETLRAHMIEEGLCRKRINKDTARVKRLFKWAASKKLVPICLPGTAHCRRSACWPVRPRTRQSRSSPSRRRSSPRRYRSC